MGLSLERLVAESQPNRPECSFGRILAKLDPDDLAVVTAALADPDVTGVAIGKVLTAEGYKVSGQTVARHRREACDCGR